MSEPSSLPPEVLAELAAITLADHSLERVMSTIADLARRTVPGAAEVSVTLVERGRPSTVATTGPMAQALDERQYERGYGPCLDSIEAGEPVLVPRIRDEQRWPGWSDEAARRGAGSVLSVPVPLQTDVAAALNLYSRDDRAFDDSSLEVGRTLAAYAGVALANMHLYRAQGLVAEQLQTAMASRAVVEQAKGVLMSRHGCTAQEAFEALARRSQESHRKLRDVAQAVVDEASGA